MLMFFRTCPLENFVQAGWLALITLPPLVYLYIYVVNNYFGILLYSSTIGRILLCLVFLKMGEQRAKRQWIHLIRELQVMRTYGQRNVTKEGWTYQ